MFNQFTTLRGVPQGVNGMSTRNFSTTIGLGKKPFSDLDSRYNLGSIGDDKRFVNPNFVNRTSPNLYRSQFVVNYRSTSTPVDIGKSSSEMSPGRTQIEVGVDVLDCADTSNMEENLVRMSSSPICISISPKLVISVTPDSLPRKDRLNSDCCSEDSFIVFECSNEEEFEDSEDEEESETESEDDGESDSDTSVDEVDFVRPRTDKKVRFNDTPTVHKIVAWEYAYRRARKGHWEQYARDRCRFRRRIETVEQALRGIFSKEHHDRIYNSRFSDAALASAASHKSESSKTKPTPDKLKNCRFC